MKRILSISLAILLAMPVLGQVEMKKTKNTIMGKKKLVATPTDKLVLDNSGLIVNLYKFAEDQGGSNNVALSAKVGVRASLSEVDEALCEEIAQEAYDYFVEQWKKRGVSVVSPTQEDIEASKAWSKAKKKGNNATINVGGSWVNKGKKHHQIWAWPKGIKIANSGKGPMAKYGNFANLLLDSKGNGFYTSISTTIDFIEFKTAKLGSTASVRSIPQLTVSNTMTAQFWQKNKVGGYTGSNSAKGIEDFYSEVKEEEVSALNSKVVMNNYVADKAKFKANVMEMIKKGIDDIFADFDAVKAGAS